MVATTVLIAERDAQWIEWAKASRKPEHVLVLIVQDVDESQQHLFERVSWRFEHLRRQHASIERVVLAAGSLWDGPTLFARAQLVRQLLVQLVQREPSTQIVLDRGAKDGPGALAMTALADAVQECCPMTPSRLSLAWGPTASTLQVA